MKRRIALAMGLAALVPTLGSAQAPPIQDDPLAREHVLRLPPGYTPAGDTPANAVPQYGLPRVQTPQYGGQQQPYQGGGAAYPTPFSPRYGGSLLGAPNSAGAVVPPVQSSRDEGGPASQPNAYGTAAPGGDIQPYGGPGAPITQEPLAPPAPQLPAGLPPGLPPGQQATAPDAMPTKAAPAQAATDAQAAPSAPAPAPAPAPATADTPRTATATPAPEVPNIWLPAGIATLQALDKVNAQTSTLTVKVGQSATFGSLTITVKSCVVRPPDQPADAAAFVDVADSHPDSSGFSGWLLENEPSVSIMQHPIYDLRVAGCA